MQVASVMGRGTVFQVGVALAQPIARPVTAAEAEPGPLLPHTGGVSILFVDDDRLVRDAMGCLLADWQIPAAICETGDEAVALLRASLPGQRWHVLLDFRLSGVEDGVSLADRITGEFGERVRVTMMSGEPDRRLIEGAAARGITLLRKPVKPTRLRAVLTAP